MAKKRRTFPPEFKLKVVLEALKERMTASEMAQKFDIHPVQISKWKTDFLENVKENIKPTSKNNQDDLLEKVEELYAKIGKLQMENEFLKKKLF